MRLFQSLLLAIVGAASVCARVRLASDMDCGKISVCGILVIETGLGSGVYKHDYPTVHGLWPEVSPYGNSECMKPSNSSAEPTKLYSCYNVDSRLRHSLQLNATMAPLEFEQHEWSSHGVCSGVRDANDFFTQVCNLVADPIDAMGRPSSLSQAASAVSKAGYPVYATDETNAQVELSVCRDEDSGEWKFAAEQDFSDVCGGKKIATMSSSNAKQTQ